jgi:hypothetical protein
VIAVARLDRCHVALAKGELAARIQRAAGSRALLVELGNGLRGSCAGQVLFSLPAEAVSDVEVLPSIVVRRSLGDLIFGGETVGFVRVHLNDGLLVLRVADMSDDELSRLLRPRS